MNATVRVTVTVSIPQVASVDTEAAGAGYSGHVHVELALVGYLSMRLGARKGHTEQRPHPTAARRP